MLKVGNLVKVKPNTKVFSTSLQANIRFDEEIIVEITNTIWNSDKHFFGVQKQLIFNLPGQIPTLIGKGTGDLSLNIDDCEPYEIPKPYFPEWIYNK